MSLLQLIPGNVPKGKRGSVVPLEEPERRFRAGHRRALTPILARARAVSSGRRFPTEAPPAPPPPPSRPILPRRAARAPHAARKVAEVAPWERVDVRPRSPASALADAERILTARRQRGRPRPGAQL